jgi:acyl-CoA reductase-like NAD-dependent aldehyde dehydrogenase
MAEAGVPPGVIQFVPGVPDLVVQTAISNPNFSALHFTGSTYIFRKLWKDIAMNVDKYVTYPRLVGETGVFNEIIYRERGADSSRWQELPHCTFVSGRYECGSPNHSWRL